MKNEIRRFKSPCQYLKTMILRPIPLIFRDEALFYGIIYLRPGHDLPFVHVQTIKHILAANPHINIPFVIVGENNGDLIKIRIRSF